MKAYQGGGGTVGQKGAVGRRVGAMGLDKGGLELG